MIDFAKLNDPVELAKVRARLAEQELQAEGDRAEIQTLVDKCAAVDEQLTGPEASLIRSCRHRLRQGLLLSRAQEKWLRGIAGHLPAQ